MQTESYSFPKSLEHPATVMQRERPRWIHACSKCPRDEAGRRFRWYDNKQICVQCPQCSAGGFWTSTYRVNA